MDEYKPLFVIDSEPDAGAVEQLVEMYDLLREGSWTLREVSCDSTEMVEQFESIRDATRRSTAGKLTLIYEFQDRELEG